ncbi:MAG: prolyl oligopeptidase family serine peptidase, partial [Lentisphaeraceae bacterium]|nr:prolyl oligopeptidase family serine peptidase [Lentisphaeraceae bacterium]
AGGHLASTALVRQLDCPAKDEVSKENAKPDFGILIYPVITMGKDTHKGSRRNLLGNTPSDEDLKYFSSELQVNSKTPPTFLAHALDDKPVPPVNSSLFHEALKKAGVETKYLELPNGGHGLSGYKGSSWDAWQKQSLEWIKLVLK